MRNKRTGGGTKDFEYLRDGSSRQARVLGLGKSQVMVNKF